jgi:hypothetical protein
MIGTWGRKRVAVVIAAGLALAACMSTAAVAGQPPGVFERYGNIHYRAADGSTRQLTRDGKNGEPVLAPDGRTVAFIHTDTVGREEGESGLTSLGIADGPTGAVRRLAGPRPHAEPKLNFASFGNPVFSLDGGYVYVDADAWTTSSAVHQVDVATGKRRFVIDGSMLAVIRSGPYRGYLLVQRHIYYGPPNYGSYNPVYVVRPDAKEMFPVPGSDNDYGSRAVAPWLRSKGWTAW